MSFFLGIDGGGTTTLTVVGDETTVLGKGGGAGLVDCEVRPVAGALERARREFPAQRRSQAH